LQNAQIQFLNKGSVTMPWQNVGVAVQTNSMALPLGPGTTFLRVRGQL
jgi:hypothetical protein